MKKTAVLGLLCALLAACGGGDAESSGEQTSGGEAVIGSCNAIAQVGMCEEYRGPIPAQALDQRRARCTQVGGAYSTTPCPTENIVGTCLAVAPAEAGRVPGTSVFGAAYRPDAVQMAQGQCAQGGGTWTAR